MSARQPAELSEPQVALDKGVVIGGRFEIEAPAARDALGQTFAARDQKTKKPIAIYLLSATVHRDALLADSIREEARNAAKLSHKSLVAIYGVGSHSDSHFIARESVTGQNAGSLIAERKRQGRALSVRGVYNLCAHVCKALGAIHEIGVHGALRPSIVWVSKAGRVKVNDLGVGAALAKHHRIDLLPPEEQAFFAPEVKSGAPVDARADVFGIGALLYALLTTRSPMDAFVIPSQVRPDASPELDALMMRCLALDPSQRFASADQVMRALLPLVAIAPESSGGDFETELEIDVDIAASLAPPRTAATISTSIGPVMIESEAAPPPAPKAATPRVLKPVAAKPIAPQLMAANDTRAHDDLGELTARLTKNDGPRWMAVKEGMDHGPFTARELIKLIVDGEVLEQHIVFNMGNNERKPLSEYSDYAPFVQQFKIRRDEQEHQTALKRSSTVEKRSTAAKFLILSVSVGAVVLAGAGYVMSRQAGQERARNESDLAALYESGQVKISGTAGILQHTPRAGGVHRSSGGGASSATGFSSYEDAMNQAMELGDASKGGGERQLTSSDVAGVMNRELNRMFGCVGEELRRGGKLGRVTIDLAILGSGKVLGASVSTGGPGFQKCLANKLREVHFPNFPAPRMGARYSFNVD
ncbi:MAG TPA: protein kinase [Polyangiales bacterium]|nr:protein kinase [Polyangiales bacterium]